MSKHGRYMGEDVTKLPMHKHIDKNGKVIHGYKYYDHGIQIYKDIDIFLDGHIGQEFDFVFSKFCIKFPKTVGRINTRAAFLSKFSSKYGLWEYFIDDDGKIQAAKRYIKPRNEVKVYYDDEPSKVVVKPNVHLLEQSSAIKSYMYRTLGKEVYNIIMEGKEIPKVEFDKYLRNAPYCFKNELSLLASKHLNLFPRWGRSCSTSIFDQLFKEYEYRRFDVLKEGTPEYDKYMAEEKDRKNKLAREFKKEKEEKLSNLLWSIEDKRKAAEIAKDIIDRDRLGFDDESFKGEFYHGQKRKKK